MVRRGCRRGRPMLGAGESRGRTSSYSASISVVPRVRVHVLMLLTPGISRRQPVLGYSLVYILYNSFAHIFSQVIGNTTARCRV